MIEKISELSVFFPTYNEEGNIKQVTLDVKRVLERVANKWEIIIVDDGSTDTTSKIAADLSKEDHRISVIHHKVNRGYGGALKTGFENAKYSWVAFMDADGQFDFSEIKKFIEKKDKADLILGFRKKRADSLARKVFTFGWATLSRIVLGLRAKDYSCGFKMIKKKVYDSIQPLTGEEKVTQIELLVKARKKGFKFEEVGVSHYPRVSGKQTGAKLKVVLKSLFDLFKLWGNLHEVTKRETLIVLAILAIGAFCRLYKIDQYMTFLGDEGRDVIIVRRFLVEHHPPLIGPGTSIGNMYLGPLYYYMMAPALLIANFSPVGPAIMVALIGIATIKLIWWVGREWFGKTAGLVAAGLYAIAPTVIIYSSSSWNPNIMPFFALLSIYSIWKVWKRHEFNWLIVLGIAYAFVLQSHYLGLLLLPVVGLFWILTILNLKSIGNWKLEIGSFAKKSLIALGFFAILMSPLLIFDLRHNFQNFNAMKQFVLDSSMSFQSPVGNLQKFADVFNLSSVRLIAGRVQMAGVFVSVIFLLFIIWQIVEDLRKKVLLRNSNYLILLLWFLIGIFGLSRYKGDIFDHYMGFIFPAPFLLLGAFSQEMLKSRYLVLKMLLPIALVILIILNLLNLPLRYPPNRQLQRAQEIATFIKNKAGSERLNLATLSDLNNRDVYQYFLLVWGAKVVDTDPNAVAYTVTDQLFVVCERPKALCDPTHDPSAWITNFGWSKITDTWQVAGLNIFRLSHAK